MVRVGLLRYERNSAAWRLEAALYQNCMAKAGADSNSREFADLYALYCNDPAAVGPVCSRDDFWATLSTVEFVDAVLRFFDAAPVELFERFSLACATPAGLLEAADGCPVGLIAAQSRVAPGVCGVGGGCPSVESQLGGALLDADLLKVELESYRVCQKQLHDQVETLRNACRARATSMKTYQVECDRLGADNAAHKKAKAHLETLLKNETARAAEAETRVKSAETRAAEAEARAAEAEARAAEAEARVKTAETRAAEAETKATEAEATAKDAAESAAVEHRLADAANGKLRADVADAEAKIADLENKVAALELDVSQRCSWEEHVREILGDGDSMKRTSEAVNFIINGYDLSEALTASQLTEFSRTGPQPESPARAPGGTGGTGGPSGPGSDSPPPRPASNKEPVPMSAKHGSSAGLAAVQPECAAPNAFVLDDGKGRASHTTDVSEANVIGVGRTRGEFAAATTVGPMPAGGAA